jgi:hypothetical protein
MYNCSVSFKIEIIKAQINGLQTDKLSDLHLVFTGLVKQQVRWENLFIKMSQVASSNTAICSVNDV